MKDIVIDLGLAVGFTTRQMRKWKERGGVPHRWRLPLLNEAARRSIDLPQDDLVWDKPARVRPPPSGDRHSKRRGKSAAEQPDAVPDGPNPGSPKGGESP